MQHLQRGTSDNANMFQPIKKPHNTVTRMNFPFCMTSEVLVNAVHGDDSSVLCCGCFGPFMFAETDALLVLVRLLGNIGSK